MISMVLYYMDGQMDEVVSGRAFTLPQAPFHEVTNTPGVLCVTHPGYFTCIIYTRNVGSLTNTENVCFSMYKKIDKTYFLQEN